MRKESRRAPPERPRSRPALSAAYELYRRGYRWTRLNLRLERRLERLRNELGQLPRSDIGLRLKDFDPALDERLAPLRARNCELVIAEFDQDGRIAPRFGHLGDIATITPAEFMPRTGCRLSIVDLNGRVGVRKEFAGALGPFVQELEALVRLEPFDCPVPRVMNVDWDARSVTMTFICGHAVRELLAAAGAKVRDRDDPRPYTRAVERERILAGRAALGAVVSPEQINAIGAALASIHDAGFVVEDVKFGNIIIEQSSGAPFFVDLERAMPVGSLPPAVAEYLREIDLKKFRDHFGSAGTSGEAPVSGPAAAREQK